MKKKVLAIILSAALCSACVTPAFASEGTDAAAESGMENAVFEDLGAAGSGTENAISEDLGAAGSGTEDAIFEDLYAAEYGSEGTDDAGYDISEPDESSYDSADSAGYEDITGSDIYPDTSIPEDPSFGDGSASNEGIEDVFEDTALEEAVSEDASIFENAADLPDADEGSGTEKDLPEKDSAGDEPEEQAEDGVPVDEAHFPDKNFRDHIKEYYDKDDDDYLSESELASDYMYCSEKEISSLKGIEYFTKLEKLYCFNNKLQELDLSSCTKLLYVDCYGNQLQSLNVSGCSVLTGIVCYDNALQELDVSGCSALSFLDCKDNKLQKLNVSGCSAFTYLACSYNQLQELDVSGFSELADLYCQENGLQKLNVSGCSALDDLDCFNNALQELNVSSCSALETLNCYNNALQELDVSSCSKLIMLRASDNKLQKLNVSGRAKLWGIDCRNNRLTGLDITGCDRLTDCVKNGEYITDESYAAYCSANGELFFDAPMYISEDDVILHKAKPTLVFSADEVSKAFDADPFIPEFETKLADGLISWSSSDTSVAVVDRDGKVTIKGVGSAVITADVAPGEKYEAGSASFTLTVVKAKPVLAFSADKVSKTFGDAPFVSALKTKKTDGAISYSSSDTSVAVVDQDGKVTIKGAGRAKITAKAAAGECYEAGSASYTLSVAKAANKITAKNINRTSASMTRKVSIKATVKEATTLTYASNNSRLRVSSKGVITIPKNFVGSAVVTIRGKASEDYKSVIKRIRIRVRPKPTVLRKLTNPSESKMKVEWKRRGRVTGYQIQYATNSSFSSARTSRVRDKWTYERTFKKVIKKGRVYYIRIRTYKTVDGKNYYSVWSDPKKLKIKK